ncbi:MAG TPA: hypothetical protein VG900_05935 [Hyphomicrobiaceae bacterium]|nr:hypothetical protein [Hyphomicrobiaceae bacterium]
MTMAPGPRIGLQAGQLAIDIFGMRETLAAKGLRYVKSAAQLAYG